MNKETLFDKILKKEIPSKPVYEDEDVYAFYDISPQAPIHVLVIPKKKLENFTDLGVASDVEVGRLFRGAAKVAKKLGIHDQGYRVIVNNGKHGQQTVEYLHIHLLAGRQMHWPPG